MPTKEGQDVLKWLIKRFPQNLETKTTSGLTPLLLAVFRGRLEFAKVLIDAGADQSARDNSGCNIIHIALQAQPFNDKLREFLDLLDPVLRPHLFTQRNKLNVSGTTPFHTWFGDTVNNWNPTRGTDQSHNMDKLKLLLEYSGGIEVEMLNGAGDTCLHTAVMQRSDVFVEALLEYRPSLLLRENAVGRTPAEVAHDFVTAQKFQKPERLQMATQHNCHSALIARQARDFIDHPENGNKFWFMQTTRQRSWWTAEAHVNQRVKVWKVCQRFLDQLTATGEHRRRLVSLHEANDVARRLGEQYSGADKTVSLYRRHGRTNDDDDDDMPDEERVSNHDAEDRPENRLSDFIESHRFTNNSHAWCELELSSQCEGCGQDHPMDQHYSWPVYGYYDEEDDEEDEDEEEEEEEEEKEEDDEKDDEDDEDD